MPAPREHRLRLRREQRLQSQRDFERARSEGRRLVSGCLIANCLPLKAGLPVRLGVVTSRKVGNAVQRSRARRLLRESFRRHQLELTIPGVIVLVARNSIVGRTQAEVDQDFLAAMQRACLLKESLP